MKKTILTYFIGFSLLFLSSCISPKIYNDTVKNLQENQKKLTNKEKLILSLEDERDELTSSINLLKNKINELKNDSILNGNALQNLKKKYNELTKSYEILSNKSSTAMAKKAKEVKRLLEQLEESQNKLLEKEDQLNELSLSLIKKENDLKKSIEELNQRSERVLELEQIIHQKDSLVSAIKNKVSKALTGLEGEGLTIEQRNGKIYISLEEDLLFESGKYSINSSGIDALNKLSYVLASQNDIDILVEGHTDNIPIKSNQLIKNNWDLSVMRATSVVKVLLKNDKISPSQLTAAGKGEHNPIANNETAKGRKMNRRIEMILSPNLDDLYDILEN